MHEKIETSKDKHQESENTVQDITVGEIRWMRLTTFNILTPTEPRSYNRWSSRNVLLSCVNCHISRLVDASQIRVSSSRSVKPLSPFGGLFIVQSSMMCCTDWFGAPHSHSEVEFRPHIFMTSPNLPTPVRIRL